MAIPWAAAARWAPDLMMKFSSVQVRPDSQYSTCSTNYQIPMLDRSVLGRAGRALTGSLEAGEAGRKREKVMGQPRVALWWRKRRLWPPNILVLLSCSSAAAGGGTAAAIARSPAWGRGEGVVARWMETGPVGERV